MNLWITRLLGLHLIRRTHDGDRQDVPDWPEAINRT